ncbi:MAG: thiol:disulfide interchange protein DsbG [Pseudobdellovibrionaceae bacterium]|jgi:thiol:disulfide interchange protein DsbG|nr:thiol:disulfide interchange protein DsbG [Pseudobdellovibrionaceae bacterium]
MIFKTIRKSLLLLSCATMVVVGGIETADAANQPEIPAPLQTMVEKGAQIRYLGRELGLDGWVTIQAGDEQYFYSTPDGQGLLMGILFNSKGDAVTLHQINALRDKEGPAIDRLAGYSPTEDIVPSISGASTAPATGGASAPDLANPQEVLRSAAKSKAEQLYDSVQSANWIQLGDKSAPAIYTFIDPECPHCHDLIDDFRKSSYLDRGFVQLRLIPVGVLSEKSLAEAAYLIASPNPQKDLFNHLDGKENALLVDKNTNTQSVQRNMQIMQDWKLDVTPFSVYKDVGGKVKVLQGRPEDLKKLIAELR